MLIKEKLYPVYVSKNNSICQKQVIMLTVPNRKGWHYLAVKNYQNYSGENVLNITVILPELPSFFSSRKKT